VIFEQQNYGDKLKRSGAQILVCSGTATQKYLSRIQSRITLPGALLLGLGDRRFYFIDFACRRWQCRIVPGLIFGFAHCSRRCSRYVHEYRS
jgi:hypothetical protein